MSSIRSFLVGAAACAILVPFTACGGGDDGGDDDGTGGTPEGTHYGYVVSKAYVPQTNEETLSYGLDIGGQKSDKPDGIVDNQLGLLFSTLKGFNLDVSATVQEAVDEGKIMLLLDYQTKDFTTASTSGLGIKFGATSTPAACTNPDDLTTCRKHLDGNASFTLKPDSPTDVVVGKVAGGTFDGGPGNLSIQLALGTTQPINISLHKARVRATGASATGLTATIGGAILATDLKDNLIPVVLGVLQGLLAQCPTTPTPTPANTCNCTGTSAFIVTQFDKSPADCKLTLDEIVNNQVTKTLLVSDVCAGGATCTTPDALSVGIKVEAVKATF